MGLTEGKYDDLMNFETSSIYDDRQKAALAYTEAIVWHLETDDARRAGCVCSTSSTTRCSPRLLRRWLPDSRQPKNSPSPRPQRVTGQALDPPLVAVST